MNRHQKGTLIASGMTLLGCHAMNAGMIKWTNIGLYIGLKLIIAHTSDAVQKLHDSSLCHWIQAQRKAVAAYVLPSTEMNLS